MTALRYALCLVSALLAAPSLPAAAEPCDIDFALHGGLFETGFTDTTARDRAEPERWQRIVADISSTRRTFEDGAHDQRVLVGWRPSTDAAPSVAALKDKVDAIVAAIRDRFPADVEARGTVLDGAVPAIRIDMRWPGPQGGERQVITHAAVAPRCLLSVKVIGRDGSPEDATRWVSSLAEVDRVRTVAAASAMPAGGTPVGAGVAPTLGRTHHPEALAASARAILPLGGMLAFGGLLYALARRRLQPAGGWIGRAYCTVIVLGAGGWLALVLLAAPAPALDNPALSPTSLPAPAVMFAVHLAALVRPRSQWYVLALALSAGSLLSSAALIASGLAAGPTPGHVVGFLVGSGLLGLAAGTSLRPYPAEADQDGAVAARQDGR